MKKYFKWIVKGGKVILLRRNVGLFGSQWERFGVFDDKDGNAERGKLIVKQLNECAQHTENFDEDDRKRYYQ